MSFPGRDRCEFPSQSENVFPVVGLMQAFVSSQADRIMPSGEDRNPDELRFCYTNSALFRTRQNNRVIGESFGPSETAEGAMLKADQAAAGGSHPNDSLPVNQQRPNFSVCFGDLCRCKIRTIAPRSHFRAQPKAALRIFSHGEDDILLERFIGELHQLAFLPIREPMLHRAEPNSRLRILKQGRAISQIVEHGRSVRIVCEEPHDTFIAGEPNSAILCLSDGENVDSAFEPRMRRNRRHRGAIAETKRAAREPKPKSTSVVTREAGHVLSLKLLLAGRVQHLELGAVITDYAFLRGQPKIAVSSLGDGIDTIHRQPVVATPILAIVLRDSFGGIEGKSADGQRQSGTELHEPAFK